jgi:hypothetical protein
MARQKKPVSVMSIRRLGQVLENRRIGFAVRGTNWKEAQNRKRGSISRSPEEPIYVFQPPLEQLSNRETVSRLRGSLVAAAGFSSKVRNILEWRKWRNPEDYPAIILFAEKKEGYFRGGGEPVGYTDYPSRSFKALKLFSKHAHFYGISGSNVRAVIRPTKREMKELEEFVKKKYKDANSDPYFELTFTEQFFRLMVNKTARAIAKNYQTELEQQKQILSPLE